MTFDLYSFGEGIFIILMIQLMTHSGWFRPREGQYVICKTCEEKINFKFDKKYNLIPTKFYLSCYTGRHRNEYTDKDIIKYTL